MTDFKEFVAIVADGGTLSADQSAQAFDIMMRGAASPALIGAFLAILRIRGETVDEITGAARSMRAKALIVEAPADVVDTCGTGGDAKGTHNISTAAALVAAGAGLAIAKHGNRSVSSKSGSADVLEALGVNLEATGEIARRCIAEAGIGFLFAPRHHGAMKHVGPVRAELGLRTIFNLLGPLANPARARRQVVGVYHRKWVAPIARVLGNLDATHVWVVHGSDGLDELTTTGPTYVAEYKNGGVSEFEVVPEDAGLPRAQLGDLIGGDAAANAKAIRRLLEGEPSPFRNIVILNAAGALIVGGKATTLQEAAGQAAEAIDSGAAKGRLGMLIEISNS
jgi:anthranilate phosphoribosyltransferase